MWNSWAPGNVQLKSYYSEKESRLGEQQAASANNANSELCIPPGLGGGRERADQQCLLLWSPLPDGEGNR